MHVCILAGLSPAVGAALLGLLGMHAYMCISSRVWHVRGTCMACAQVGALLLGLLGMHDHQFVRYLPSFYPLFVELMHCDDKAIRQTLRDIFSQRIGKALTEKQAP